jgi:hypothetical protein
MTSTEYSRSYFVFELEKAVWKKFVVIISLYFPSAMSEYLMSEYLHVYNKYAAIVEGYIVTVQYTPSVSTIILSGPTYSSQNVRQI